MSNKRKDIFESGALSGRPVGMTAGGVGGGDDYIQKIGRRKISWAQSGFQGGPSMAADSGFSAIALQRIASPDSITVSAYPMFPDQDVKVQDDEDIYLLHDDDLEDEKMKNKFSIADENNIVEKSRYSLIDVEKLMSEDVAWRDIAPGFAEKAVDDFDVDAIIPDIIEDEVKAGYNHVRDFLQDIKDKYGDPAFEAITDKLDDLDIAPENYEKAAAVAKEIGRDIIMLAAAGLPIVGTPIAASYILYNLGEMQIGQNQARKAVDNLVVNGTELDVQEVERVASQLFNDYIDFLQAIPYLIPFVGAGKGIAGVATKAAKALGSKKAAGFLGIGGGGTIKSVLRSEILLSPIFKFVTSISDVETLDEIGIEASYFIDNVYKVPATLAVLGDLLELAESQVEEWRSAGSLGKFKFKVPGGIASPEAEERLSGNNYLNDFNSKVEEVAEIFMGKVESAGINNAVEELVQVSTIEEDRNRMSNSDDLIRQFIRETLYNTINTGSPPMPTGYVYRRPDEANPDEDPYEKDTKSVVNYKTDMGGVSYSPVTESLKKEALRRIIRRKLQEQKKTF